MEDFPARHGQGNQHQDDRQACDNRSAQHLIDGVIDHRFFSIPPACSQILTNAVEDDDRIGQRVASESQQSRNDKQGDFLVQEIKRPQDSQDIVKCGNRRSDAESKFKPCRDIEDDARK